MNPIHILESLLFVASKPLSLKNISKVLDRPEEETAELIETLRSEKYSSEKSGIVILESEGNFQMSSHADAFPFVEKFIKTEVGGELTKAQLETLTIIAYRGPITRPEIEQIRGVNCAVILRNLQMRGLVEDQKSENKIGEEYFLSLNALAHLGIESANELPKYAELSSHDYVENQLEQDSEAEEKISE